MSFTNEDAESVIRMFTTDHKWVQVVNYGWDPQEVPEFDPEETPFVGAIRRFNPNPYRSQA